MNIFLIGKSDAEDLVIDFIEMELKTGKTVSLDWDFSRIERKHGGQFEATYEGLNIGGKSACGLSLLKGQISTFWRCQSGKETELLRSIPRIQ